MIVLWLLVAHLCGDYLFQTRWQAVGKFGWSDEAYWLRTRHVLAYTAAFAPVAVVYGWGTGASQGSGTLAFLVLLAGLHFVTDAQRFARTPGEWIAWHFLGANPTPAEKRGVHAAMEADTSAFDLPPNPWPTIGLAIDQTLHLMQIAALASLFL